MTWSHHCVEWTRASGSITVATKFHYWAVVGIPSPPAPRTLSGLEERVRERRPFVSKFICHNTSQWKLRRALAAGPSLPFV